MHVLITGAAGFVGAALVQRLQTQSGLLPGATPLQLTLVDRSGSPDGEATGVTWHTGSFADPALMQRLKEQPPQYVFHLASMPGALAERQPTAGVQANLLDVIQLLEGLALAVREGRGAAPRLVFASSVAVYGAVGPDAVQEDQLPQPGLSYGTHKWMTELLLADYSRRGELDACSLRLPGVVARPPAESGHGSAFMSQIFHSVRSGVPYECPVAPDATAWWMSLDRCLDNLLHAALLGADRMPVSRTWQLPVLQARVGEVVDTLSRQLNRPSPVRYVPDARIQALFGQQPALHTPHAQAAGFAHDGTVDALAERVLRSLPSQ